MPKPRKTPKKDVAAASVLGTYHDMPIIESTIAITNAGDGLSKAMVVDPVNIEIGDDVFVVLATTASQVKLKPHKDQPNMLVKTIVLSAGVATIVEKDLVSDVLKAQQLRIEEHAGIQRLPMEDDGGELPPQIGTAEIGEQ